MWVARFKQNQTRIAIITSMSAVRGYSYGGSHCAAKGAIDTGLYDKPSVQQAVKDIVQEYQCDWGLGLRLAPPTIVGEAVNLAFTTPGHIPSINLVAIGQFPHEGS